MTSGSRSLLNTFAVVPFIAHRSIHSSNLGAFYVLSDCSILKVADFIFGRGIVSQKLSTNSPLQALSDPLKIQGIRRTAMNILGTGIGVLLLQLLANSAEVNAQININPWTTNPLNEPYENQVALVGGIIRFFWPANETHNVWMYPSLTCFDTTGRIPVGNSSGAGYVFRDDDGSETGNTLLFTSDIDSNCAEQGMRLMVTVFSGNSLPPMSLPSGIPASISPSEVPLITTSPTTTNIPTDSPTGSPTDAVNITDSPSTAPTTSPVAPSLSPVALTETPTNAFSSPVPTEVPTDSPSVLPTLAPTSVATTTLAPSTAGPSLDTSNPTPLTSTKNITMRGLQMEIFGINSFGTNTQNSWERTTAEFSKSSIEQALGDTVIMFDTKYNVTASTIVIVPQSDEGSQRRRTRGLQTGDITKDSVIITFSQNFLFDTTDPSITAIVLATTPFESEANRDRYVTFLNENSNNLALSRVNDASEVTVATPGTPTTPPRSEEPTIAPYSGDSNELILSVPAIIGIACGGGALIVLVVIYFLCCRKPSSKKDAKSSSTPPMAVSISRDDDVSTLHPPTVTGGMNGHGDQSVGTVDYDYAKAYGNGDTDVSSAGGTFGSNMHNQYELDPKTAAAIGAALGPFDDDGSFEAHYRAPGSNVKEEVLHVFAPPGKLGVVIDTPENGAPMVHAVKDTSVIYGRVQVGDKLVAVDDEDCRTMSAVKVSKLISRKSANPSRKLTIVRTTTID